MPEPPAGNTGTPISSAMSSTTTIEVPFKLWHGIYTAGSDQGHLFARREYKVRVPVHINKEEVERLELNDGMYTEDFAIRYNLVREFACAHCHKPTITYTFAKCVDFHNNTGTIERIRAFLVPSCDTCVIPARVHAKDALVKLASLESEKVEIIYRLIIDDPYDSDGDYYYFVYKTRVSAAINSDDPEVRKPIIRQLIKKYERDIEKRTTVILPPCNICKEPFAYFVHENKLRTDTATSTTLSVTDVAIPTCFSDFCKVSANNIALSILLRMTSLPKWEAFEQPKLCGFCKKGACPQKCGRCRGVRYCSRECQKGDWPRHKPFCVEPKKFGG